jgi:hypothetical protein
MACSAYDAKRLPDQSAAQQPSSGSGGRSGSGGGGGATAQGGASAGTTGLDPDAQVGAGGAPSPIDDDAAVIDAAVDAGALADAGCMVIDAGQDCCDDDPDKVEPGQCGCGVEDTDGDADGTADCVDGCPTDMAKSEPGICGCGRPDQDTGGLTSCAGLVSALVHRYRFGGSGTDVTDSFGSADGEVINTTLTDTDQLDLAGGISDEYVALPSGLLSSLTDATIEVWLRWDGGSAWQRIFDFGDNDASSQGDQGVGQNYLFLTPRSASGSGTLRVAFTTNGSGNETRLNASQALSSGGIHHVAVVFDASGGQLRLYVDGAPVAMTALSGSLAALRDDNNWLGRSQYSNDPSLEGSLHEVRIYGEALEDEQIELSFDDGPDPAYLER